MFCTMGLLFADFSWEQLLASGVLGGGVGIMFAAVAPLWHKAKNPKQENPLRKTTFLMAAVIFLVGLAMAILGIWWRQRA